MLLLKGPIDENEYTVLSLNEPMEPTEPIELKEPIEPIELKERIEENAEAYDECTLIDDPVDIEDAKFEAYDECKLLLPLPDDLMEELTNRCTLIDDPVDMEEEKSEAYDECKSLLLPSPDELIERTNVGNKVGNNMGGKVGDKVGGSTVGTEQRPHVRRQKELSNSRRQKPCTSLTSSRRSASPNPSTHDDEAGFAVGTTFGAAIGTTVGGAAVGRLAGALEGLLSVLQSKALLPVA